MFDEAFADEFDFDVLDSTKIIPEELVPIRRVGRLVLDKTVDNFFAETEQVAFCTQNVPPGIDFTNDPLLQGRNFSYLDTQLKRLGSPNFTFLPVNAPRCPFATFQQDGHMAMSNPIGRSNYEPSSLGQPGEARESPDGRVPDVPGRRAGREAAAAPGELRRPLQPGPAVLREPDADRADCTSPTRSRSSSARWRRRPSGPAWWPACATSTRRWPRPSPTASGSPSCPDPLPAAMPTRDDLPESPALSILLNGPDSFAGRKVGILVSDDADASLLSGVQAALDAEGAIYELVAPKVGGVVLSDGTAVEADQKVEGGPSVLYDAVVILVSADGAAELAQKPEAKDFVTDAFAHAKFVGHTAAAAPLFDATGITALIDDGFVDLDETGGTERFVECCRDLRYWQRVGSVG